MWPLIALLDTFEFEFEPISTIKMMDAPVVAEQVLQTIILLLALFHIMT